jgi:hypothetical protein
VRQHDVHNHNLQWWIAQGGEVNMLCKDHVMLCYS